ncbi:MAG TPA: 5-formyltetrahydrofolate cyclo-ligase [Rhizomicrobium sp.]|nr:5-formyltetrahydrofolate cyclo-ligase [Rhizomicrobium sp.]
MMISKAKLRAAARERRAQLAEDLPDFAKRVASHAVRLPLTRRTPVASYWPLRDEADPGTLAATLAEFGHPILLPRVMGKDQPLSFRLWRQTDETEVSAFGVPEPLASAPEMVPAAVLVPLLAFDASGVRLGYGGGYYDRTLAALRAQGRIIVIGIAYSGQEKVGLPTAPHDEKLDMVLTEKGLRRFPQR